MLQLTFCVQFSSHYTSKFNSLNFRTHYSSRPELNLSSFIDVFRRRTIVILLWIPLTLMPIKQIMEYVVLM